MPSPRPLGESGVAGPHAAGSGRSESPASFSTGEQCDTGLAAGFDPDRIRAAGCDLDRVRRQLAHGQGGAMAQLGGRAGVVEPAIDHGAGSDHRGRRALELSGQPAGTTTMRCANGRSNHGRGLPLGLGSQTFPGQGSTGTRRRHEPAFGTGRQRVGTNPAWHHQGVRGKDRGRMSGESDKAKGRCPSRPPAISLMTTTSRKKASPTSWPGRPRTRSTTSRRKRTRSSMTSARSSAADPGGQ